LYSNGCPFYNTLESLNGRNLTEDAGVGVKIILKLLLNKRVLRVWAAFILLRMGV
jgi:hypothetical protein